MYQNYVETIHLDYDRNDLLLVMYVKLIQKLRTLFLFYGIHLWANSKVNPRANDELSQYKTEV